MKITNGIHMLELQANIMGKQSFIYPTLILDEDSVILIDTGFPGQLAQIREAIEEEGVSFNKLNTLILTHQDIDHVGNAAGIKRELGDKVQVLAHEEEEQFINGEKKPVKLAKLEEQLNFLPDNMKMIYEKLKAGFESSRVNVDKTLMNDEELDYCGGITAIYTPGHTPGHISLYLKQQKILIAGDILKVEGGLLVPADETINYDKNLNINSMKKLTNYDIETVICYHGGLYEHDVNKRIEEWASNL